MRAVFFACNQKKPSMKNIVQIAHKTLCRDRDRLNNLNKIQFLQQEVMKYVLMLMIMVAMTEWLVCMSRCASHILIHSVLK